MKLEGYKTKTIITPQKGKTGYIYKILCWDTKEYEYYKKQVTIPDAKDYKPTISNVKYKDHKKKGKQKNKKVKKEVEVEENKNKTKRKYKRNRNKRAKNLRFKR